MKFMVYDIYETDAFTKIFESMSKDEQEWIQKMKAQITINPKVGDPLRFGWFREKKHGDKRLYFIISMKTPRVLLVAYGPKKEQQKIIDYILLHKD